MLIAIPAVSALVYAVVYFTSSSKYIPGTWVEERERNARAAFAISFGVLFFLFLVTALLR